jgi:hypothetical protein
MTKIKSIYKTLQETKVSTATGALALFALSLAILDYTPSMEVEGASTLQANLFAVLDMASK